MRAALISEYKTAPVVAERDEPQPAAGRAILELRAAGLNPVDLAIASGAFPAGSPAVPYVPGVEGVGSVVASDRFAAGTRVWASGRGLGVAADGAFSERFATSDDSLVEVPAEADDELAAALGVVGLAAWMPLSWLAPVRTGESVLVLGATGAVGSVAVQAAQILGAGRVVGVGRDAVRLERALSLGADAVVSLEGDGLPERLRACVAEAPPTLVLDALWGAPLEAAISVAGPGARIVHLGQSAGPTATLASGLVRGKQLQILGYSNFTVPHEQLAQGYRDLVGHAAAGRIRVDLEAFPLERVGEAWARQVQGSAVKLVLVP